MAAITLQEIARPDKAIDRKIKRFNFPITPLDQADIEEEKAAVNLAR